MVGQALGLVAGPGLEGGDELALVDQAVLKREQSEEEMAVGGGSHGVAPIVVGRSGKGPSLRGRPRDHVASGRLSQVRHAFASVPPSGVRRPRSCRGRCVILGPGARVNRADRIRPLAPERDHGNVTLALDVRHPADDSNCPGIERRLQRYSLMMPPQTSRPGSGLGLRFERRIQFALDAEFHLAELVSRRMGYEARAS